MLAMVEGFPLDQVAMPDLEALLSPDDLDFMLKDLTPEIYQSDDACNAA
jgi:hypothetical protein